MQDNICIRCGKQRKVLRSWNEHAVGSLLTYTLMVCPDEECQKIVDKGLLAEKQKREAFKIESERRAALRRTEKDKDFD